MELKRDPHILKILLESNPKLHFLKYCLSYNLEFRPTADVLFARMSHLILEGKLHLLHLKSVVTNYSTETLIFVIYNDYARRIIIVKIHVPRCHL